MVVVEIQLFKKFANKHAVYASQVSVDVRYLYHLKLVALW